MRVPMAIASVALLLSLSACSYTDDVWSSVAGDDDTGANAAPAATTDNSNAAPSDTGANTVATQPIAGPPPSAPSGTALGTSSFAPPTSVASGPDTGTFVGQKVRALRSDLQRLYDNINHHNSDLQRARQTLSNDANSYYGIVGGINSHLQVGTTPGNPDLTAQWNQAQGSLDRMNNDLASLNSLSNQAASDLALAAYMLEEIKAAFSLQGAVDEDHRQLNALQSDVNSAIVVIQQMTKSVTDDITRQNNYIATERRNLTTLALAIKNGELYGQSFSARPPLVAAATGGTPAYAAASPASVGDRRPLVTIRFDRANVSYEQALYTAVSRALDRRPNAVFDLVAVAPNAGSPAQVSINADESKRNAENVMRSLAKMGLPADRVSVSAATSSSAQSPEVQIYVR